MRTVIFDLDGTLADTSRDLIAAATSRFRALGHGDLLDPVADAATAFRGGRAMLRLGFERLGAAEDAAIEAEVAPFLEAYAAGIDLHTTLYPGAREAVELLKSEGYTVGICTNKPSALAEDLMKKLGVRSLFASLIGADTLPVRKPDPAPLRAAVEQAGGDIARTVLVGDTVTDRETGRAAGVPVILVTFGPEGDGVARLSPEALLPGYGDLTATVAGLIG
ncbi:MAG: HAD-IA family hydrolase [Pseudomonadota bacterium]